MNEAPHQLLDPDQSSDVQSAVIAAIHETAAYSRSLVGRISRLAEAGLTGDAADHPAAELLRTSISASDDAWTSLSGLLEVFQRYEEEHGETWSPRYAHEGVVEEGDELAEHHVRDTLESKATEFGINENVLLGLTE